MLSVQPPDWTAVGATVGSTGVDPGSGVTVMRMTTPVGRTVGGGVGVVAPLHASVTATRMRVTILNAVRGDGLIVVLLSWLKVYHIRSPVAKTPTCNFIAGNA
jgi:hypothetical protein